MGGHHKGCPPPADPHPCHLSFPTQTHLHPRSWPVLSLQAIVIHVYKEDFEGWKFTGGLCTNAFFQKQSSLGVCIPPLSLVSPSFSFLSLFFSPLPHFFGDYFAYLYCAYFPEYLRKPDMGDCVLIYMMFHRAGREKTHIAKRSSECEGFSKVSRGEESWLKEFSN